MEQKRGSFTGAGQVGAILSPVRGGLVGRR